MRKRLLLYTLPLTSAVLYATMASMDTYIIARLISDPWVFGLAIFIVGSLSAVPLVLLLSLRIGRRPIGSRIDPNFTRIIVPRGRLLLLLLVASLANACSSVIYFYLVATSADPAAVLAFGALVSVYLLFADAVYEKERPSLVEIQAITMIAVGVLLVSLSRGRIDALELALVLGPYNVSAVVYNYAMKSARSIRLPRGRRYDSINLRFWLILFSTLFFAALSAPLAGLERVARALVASFTHFTMLAIDMTITFMAYVCYIRALGLGKMSTVNALAGTSPIFALAMTPVLSLVAPDVFSLAGIDPVFWAIKALGVTMAVVGVASLALTEVRAYVLVKARPCPPSRLLLKLIRIRGVEMVSVCAGQWDFVLRVRLRSLGQAYERIVRQLERIPEIEDFVWVTVLAEYEAI